MKSNKLKNNLQFKKTDCQVMTLLNKGEILFMNKQGFTIRDITKAVNRSKDWVSNIIGALTGSDIEEELLDLWGDKQDENTENRTNKKTTSVRGTRVKIKQRRNKKMYPKRVYKTISGNRVIKHKPNIQSRIPGDNSGNINEPRKSRKSTKIIDTFRNHVDYQGE